MNSLMLSLLLLGNDNSSHFLRGLSYTNEGEHDSAAVYFQNLPDTIDEYLFYKGRNDYFRGIWASAEERLLRHRESFPNSIYADRASYLLGSLNFKRQEYKEAIRCWSDLIILFPNSHLAAAAVKGIADAHFNLKEYQEALSHYQKVKDYKPASKILNEAKLRSYETRYYLKKFPSLKSALQKFIEENPENSLVPATHLRIAKILFAEKEYYQSLIELDKLINAYPNSRVIPEALFERARVAQNLGKVAEQKKSLQLLLAEKETKNYYCYAANALATLYLQEAKYDSSLYYYNILLTEDEYREMAVMEIARIYGILKQYKESELMINKLISDFPNSVLLVEAHILKSRLHRHQGNYPLAITILTELLAKTGQRPEIYLELGHIFFEINDYPKARDNYLLACEQHREQRDAASEALILAGDAAAAMADKKNAQEYYRRAQLIAQSVGIKEQATAKLIAVSEE